jgi:lipid-A-disaccharide synthase-like uncharacterized protein
VTKQTLLHWAEVIDSWRVFPRLFLIGCFAWTVEVTRWLLQWYTLLPREDRGVEASGFASIVFVAVLGFLKLVYSTYSASSRDWNQQPVSSQTTVTQATTTVQAPSQ